MAHPVLVALLLEQGTISLNHGGDGIGLNTGVGLGEHLGEVDAGFGEPGEQAAPGDDNTGDRGRWIASSVEVVKSTLIICLGSAEWLKP